jgi:hypothetical protein
LQEGNNYLAMKTRLGSKTQNYKLLVQKKQKERLTALFLIVMLKVQPLSD